MSSSDGSSTSSSIGKQTKQSTQEQPLVGVIKNNRVPPHNTHSAVRQPTEQQSKSSTKVSKADVKGKKSTNQTIKETEVQKQQKPATSNGNSSNRRQRVAANGATNKSSNILDSAKLEATLNAACSSLDDFSLRAKTLKGDINEALEKQAANQNSASDQPPPEVVQLKAEILRLSGSMPSGFNCDENGKSDKPTGDNPDVPHECDNRPGVKADEVNAVDSAPRIDEPTTNNQSSQNSNQPKSNDAGSGFKSDLIFNQALDKLNLEVKREDEALVSHKSRPQPLQKISKSNTKVTVDKEIADSKETFIIDSFESLYAKLDVESKFVALKSSLQKEFAQAPHLLEPICRKLVEMSEQNSQLMINHEQYQLENERLLMYKQKLENLCRELQKSNNAIRIESLDLIKAEQSKAKEQTTKIQSTLSGVIKLFDENQQRNMSLRQENHELQCKLKSLLDHCDNWEKSVEAALRQREIENRLVKTELAKANLLKNEEKEKFLSEKQELLQILSMMQEQQHRIEGQEAKLRSDLSSYASKYDECQAVISKGMNKFQIESKRMLKQIELSKQDYKDLLSKYEASNKRMAKLLEEKRQWDEALKVASRKVETLEKLCRALQERKSKVEVHENESGKNLSDVHSLTEMVDSRNESTQTLDTGTL